MTASAPWSVKGIDAKAREVAKDLARRSGMTLGEWLNQMILEGEDVGALISREKARSEAPVQRAVRRVAEPEIYDDEGYEEPVLASRTRQSLRGDVLRDDPARRATPYSTRAIASKDLRRKSIFEDRPRYDDGYEAAPDADMGRVARALENLGSRIETGETRSATAVRGVSHAVESLLSRLERSEAALEAAQTETREQLEGRFEEQTQEVLSTVERLSRAAEQDQGVMTRRLEQAERLLDAQAERLEGLSGHVREERDRIAKVEQSLKSSQVTETVRAVEGALGKLANQLYEGEARTRDTMKDVREDLVGLSHRLAQMEMRDPERAAQGLIDKVVAQLANRLEAAEAQTTGAIKTLEKAFQTLEGRMHRAEERGDVSDPEAVRSLTGLAAELSRRVEDSRQELRQALQTGTQESIETAMKTVAERINLSEQRSASAIGKMGQDVMRIADTLNRRVATVEVATRDGLLRVSQDIQTVAASVADTVDARVGRFESAHAQALESLGTEIARISERLSVKLSESERRTTQILGGVGEQIEQQRNLARSDLADRIRQSEDRTAKLLEDARARIDQKLAQVQTQNLLSEAAAKSASARQEPRELPNPFATSQTIAAESPAARVYAPVLEAEPEIDTILPVAGDEPKAEAHEAEASQAPTSPFDTFLGGLEPDELVDLAVVTEVKAEAPAFATTSPALSDFKPDFDPFADDDDAELLTSSVTGPSTSSAVIDDDDSDPFADIDVSRKTAPRSDGRKPSSFSARDLTEDHSAERIDFDIDENDVRMSSVSVSTRDALAAARAAVRASIEGLDDGRLNTLKSKSSRSRSGLRPIEEAKSNTFMNALKASSIAAAVVAVAAGGAMVVKTQWLDPVARAKKPAPIAAAALTVAPVDADAQRNLQTRYQAALQALEARSPGAIDGLKVVANQGYAPAQYQLSLAYGGQGSVATPDKTEARLWTQRAADGGIAAAMYNLGSMYYSGDGGPQDRPMAAMWFRKAAERGVLDSQYNLGILYQEGMGVPINLSESYKWLKIAAKGGDKDAAKAASDLEAQLTDSQRQKAEDAVAQFTPISDGTPLRADAKSAPQG